MEIYLKQFAAGSGDAAYTGYTLHIKLYDENYAIAYVWY